MASQGDTPATSTSTADSKATRKRLQRGSKSANRWIILVGLFFVSFLENGVVRSFAVIINDLTVEFNVTTAYMGAILGFIFGAPLLLSFLPVMLLRHFSTRQLVMTGGVMSTAGLICSSFAQNSSQFAAALSAYGLGYVLLILPTNACSIVYFPDKFMIATGIMLSGGSVGLMLMPLVFEALVVLYGWRGAVFILGAFNAHMVAIGALLKFPKKTLSNTNVEENKNDSLELKSMEPNSTADQEIDTCTKGTSPFPERSRRSTLTWEENDNISVSSPNLAEDCELNESNMKQTTSNSIKSIRKRQRGIENEVTVAAEVHENGTGDGSAMTIESLSQCSVNPSYVHDVTDPTSESIKNNGSPYEISHIENDKMGEDHATQGKYNPLMALKRFAIYLGLDIFMDHPFLVVICIQTVMFGVSYNGWLLYIIPNALAKGLTPQSAVQISLAGGICNFFGRLGIGFFASKEYIKMEYWYSLLYLLSAAAFWINFVADSFLFLMILSAVYGVLMGAKPTAQFLMVKRVVSEDRYRGGLTMSFICIGLSSLLTGPMLGALYDRTQSYDISFCGVSLFDLGVAIITLLPLVWSAMRQGLPCRSTFRETVNIALS